MERSSSVPGASLAGILFLGATALVPELRAQEPSPGAADSGAERDIEFFETEIRPLFVRACLECHGRELARPKGGLVLDSRARLFAGGDEGAVVVPGDVEASLLIEAVRYAGATRMPPAGKLEEREIALLEQWVRRGAPMPEDEARSAAGDAALGSASAASTHWAFQPMADPRPPEVRDERWCTNEIDRFVLARLEEAGLPAPALADKRTLLRRLSFDLTGLPPTTEELERFVADASPDAWAREVDRLLASPHYGERWGRAWLDLARYSDSNGLDENLAMANAWRYRDWVVRALNQDLSYDRFLTWQLAGDLLPEPEDRDALKDQLAATGFLVLGPKMLAEQDKEKLLLDVVDEQLDVAFRAFQGLTVGCARCHDHKFDPLSQREYTALAGVFRSTATMANTAFVSRWNSRELGSKQEIAARRAGEERIADAEAAVGRARDESEDALRRRWIAACDSYLLAASFAGEATLLIEAEDSSRGNLIRDDATYGSKETVVLRTGSGGLQFVEYDLTFAAAGRRAVEVRLAAEESRPMRVLLDGASVIESALGAKTGSWKPDGQRWVHLGAIDFPAGRSVLRLERDGAVPHLDRLLFAPAPVAGGSAEGGSSWAVAGNPWADGLDAPVVRQWTLRLETAERVDDPILGPWLRFARLENEGAREGFEERARSLAAELRGAAENPLVARLFEGLPPRSLREVAARYQVLFSTIDAQWREARAADPKTERLAQDGAEAIRQALFGPTGVLRLEAGELEPLFPPESRERLASARAALELARGELPPALERALGVADGESIADLPLMRRGNHLDKGPEPIPRGVPGLVRTVVDSPAMPQETSGRLELARWMTAAEHPLTARVAANRVWQGHFGAGLVRTSANFGLRGEAPSHPELLDWLARELVRGGWSLKALHRAICLSSAYRVAAEPTPLALERDPENRLLSRRARLRLDAESLRDAWLCAAGRLDPAIGGTLLEIGDGDYVTNDQSKDSARYDAPRRSLYLPIIRNAMLDLFGTFDYPDPSTTIEARPTTTSPLQALYLMNAPLVVDCAARLGRRAVELPDAAGRVRLLVRACHGREPRAAEVARFTAFAERALAEPALARDAGSGLGPGSKSGAGRAQVGEPPADADSEARVRRELEVWSSIAQVLLVSNEFLFVE